MLFLRIGDRDNCIDVVNSNLAKHVKKRLRWLITARGNYYSWTCLHDQCVHCINFWFQHPRYLVPAAVGLKLRPKNQIKKRRWSPVRNSTFNIEHNVTRAWPRIGDQQKHTSIAFPAKQWTIFEHSVTRTLNSGHSVTADWGSATTHLNCISRLTIDYFWARHDGSVTTYDPPTVI